MGKGGGWQSLICHASVPFIRTTTNTYSTSLRSYPMSRVLGISNGVGLFQRERKNDGGGGKDRAREIDCTDTYADMSKKSMDEEG